MSYSYSNSNPLDGCSCSGGLGALPLSLQQLEASRKLVAGAVAQAQAAGVLPPVTITKDASGKEVVVASTPNGSAMTAASSAGGGFFSGKMPLYLGIAAVGVVGIVLLKRKKR